MLEKPRSPARLAPNAGFFATALETLPIKESRPVAPVG